MDRSSNSNSNTNSLLKRPVVLAALFLGVLVVLRPIPVVAQVVLVIFGGVVMAVLVDGVSSWLARHTPAPRWLALTLFVTLSVDACGAIFWLMGERISNEISALTQRVNENLQQLESALQKNKWTSQLLQNRNGGGGFPDGEMWGRVGGVFSTAFGAIASGSILLVIALCLAVDPQFYVRNALRLTPSFRRDRYAEVVAETGAALRWWFVGRFSSMAAVGSLTAIGLWIANVPMALALGLIAGLFSFVPFVGPIVAAVPGLIVAWGQDTMTAVYALIVYVAVQALEGNLITPLIQKRAVAVPPALLIAAQLLFGSLFGFWGVLWATPLIVVIMVLT